MSPILRLLESVPLAGLMLVVTTGFLLGRLRWRALSLGPAGGTLLVAIGFGIAGLSMRTIYGGTEPTVTVGFFGFCLFIYSVGFEAGPRFFASFRRGPGWRFVVLSTLVNVLTIGIALGCGALASLDGALTAGALAGAITSAPTYAAASEVLDDPSRLSKSFALAYPVGLVLLVFIIQALPRRMGDDLAEGDDDQSPAAGGSRRRSSPELTRAFRVMQPGVIGPALCELNLTRKTGCFISRIHRGEEILVPGAETDLRLGDHLMVTGRLDQLARFGARVGPEVYDADLRNRLPAPRAVVVMAKAVLGKPLSELDLIKRHRCLIVRIRRGEISLDPSAEFELLRGDTVEVVGARKNVKAVAEELGRFEASSLETDIAIYAGGILLGLLLGMVHLRFGEIDLTLGAAGGLLLVGLVLGRFRQIGPFSANVPPAARQLVRDMGILLFVAETGVRAGNSPLGQIAGGQVLGIILTAVAVTVVPVLTGVIVGRRVLGLKPVDAWGSVCGGMTSSAALTAVRNAADSNAPAVSYSAAFAVASVIVTIAGRLVVRVMGV